MCGLCSEGGNVVGIAAKPVPSKVALSSMETSYGCRSPYSCTRDTQGIPKGYPREQQALNTGATPEQHARNRLATGSQEACITPGPKPSCPCNEKLPRCPRGELPNSTLGTVLP